MSPDWQPPKLASFWKPQPVEGPQNPFNDYPCLELIIPVFSKRAVDALGTMLTENGELLPLKSKMGEYLAYNCLTKIAALDLKRSIVERPSSDEIALDVP